MGSKMKISEHVRTTITQDGAVLMNIKGGHMVTLNPVGSIIWQQLSEGRSPEGIAVCLAADFGISRELALTDVNEFVRQLEAQQLLLPSDSDGSQRKRWPGLKGLICNLLASRGASTSDRSTTK
jgi:hypothetical protein